MICTITPDDDALGWDGPPCGIVEIVWDESDSGALYESKSEVHDQTDLASGYRELRRATSADFSNHSFSTDPPQANPLHRSPALSQP